MIKIDHYQEALRNVINNRISHICVSGISGVGKTHLIRSVCREFTDSLWVDYDFAIYLNSLNEIVLEKLKIQIKKKQLPFTLTGEDISISEQIFEVIEFLNASDMQLILSFENIVAANHYELSFISKLINFSSLYPSLCIIIENDTDGSNENIIKLRESTIFEILTIPPFEENDLRQYICERTKTTSLEATESDWKRLYDVSQGTLSIINIILNELAESKYLTKNDDKLMIHELPQNFLLHGVQPYIIKRFEKLEQEHKELLVKSSCIGYTFEGDDAIKIFSNARAITLLKNIQEASHLICELQENRFQFESLEAHATIQKRVDGFCDRNAVLKTCAQYFASSLNSQLKKQDYTKYINNLTLAKDLYKSIVDIPNLLSCYRLLIGCKIENKSFEEAKELCLDYNKNCNNKQAKYINNLNLLHCCMELEDFETGHSLILELQKESGIFSNLFKYYSALCFYGISDGKSALEVLHSYENTLDTKTEPLLAAKSLRLLSSVYDFYEDWSHQIKYFNKALTVCKEFNLENEYYSMLRQSGMIYPYDIAMEFYSAAEEYFKKNNNIRELGKVTHNIAMDSLYMNDVKLSYSKCEDSIVHFRFIGSQNISNPLNLKGILLFCEENDPTGALDQFLKAAQFNQDKFIKCVCYLNAATVYRKLSDYDKYEQYMQRSKELNQGSMPIITIGELLGEMLFFYDLGNLTDCRNAILELRNLGHLLEFRHLYVIRYIEDKLSIRLENDSLYLDSVNIKTNYINSTCKDYLERCLQKTCYWMTTRFWEN